ncbi:MAG TPA: efflux RND transporter periplasmic adaptor subunit [Polyangiaceae bacterium]|nr:efflux RND transporter periplasmic adaptor subunit [Polyangiaceae bacterium]
MLTAFLSDVLERTARGAERRLLGLACVATLVACSKVEAQPAQTLALPVATAASSTVQHEREYVGELHAVRYAEIRSRVNGQLERLAVDEGQQVEKDQLLFAIAATELRQEMLKARASTKRFAAELDLAQIERANTRTLFEKDIVSAAEVALADSRIESLQAGLEEAKANEKQATINAAYSQIRAPFPGTINRILKRAGAQVAEGDLLTTLSDASEVYAYFPVSEREYLEHRAAPGADGPERVQLKLADGRLHPHPGVIDAVDSQVDQRTGTLAFRARFPNPDGVLKHGSSGKVVLSTSIAEALVVPQKATFEVQGQLYVYAVDEDNKAHARKIVPKLRLDDAFVIAAGLTAEDRFVLEGVQKVKDGSQLDPLPADGS